MRKALLLALPLAALAGAARALEYVPIYNVTLLGGQYFFAGDRTKLNGNASARFAPVMKPEDSEWTLLPIYRGSFRGTKAVTDAVGAGSLFSQGMDHRLSFTGVRAVSGSDWKLKPSVNYKYEFLKETRDETWGKGLFDCETSGVSFEGEKVYRDPFSYRLGYDFYYVRFPNYQSLESKSGVDPSGNPLNREDAGTRVLDSINNQLSAFVTLPLPDKDPKLSLEAGYRLLWQKFPDQPIIDQRGQPAASHRQDFTNTLSLNLGYPRKLMGDQVRMGSGFYTAVSYNGSNQNTFDAGQMAYVGDSYSYWSLAFGPSVNFAWSDEKRPITAGAGLTFSRQGWLGRRIQDAAGVYLDGKLRQDRVILGLNYGYPIAQNFRLSAQTNFLWASSNMRFEKTYKYTYNAATYLMGFTYDY